MKKYAILAVVGSVSVLTALSLSSSKPEVELSPLQRANVEALTQGEGYVDYDEFCISHPTDVCVTNHYTLLRESRGFKKNP